MITDLQHTLRSLRANRLTNYGNSAYQRITNDWHFKSVPDELRELWYGLDTSSFMTLSNVPDSAIDSMSHDELVRLIDSERWLIARLESVFSNL